MTHQGATLPTDVGPTPRAPPGSAGCPRSSRPTFGSPRPSSVGVEGAGRRGSPTTVGDAQRPRPLARSGPGGTRTHGLRFRKGPRAGAAVVKCVANLFPRKRVDADISTVVTDATSSAARFDSPLRWSYATSLKDAPRAATSAAEGVPIMLPQSAASDGPDNRAGPSAFRDCRRWQAGTAGGAHHTGGRTPR